jgi:hypothetical protein
MILVVDAFNLIYKFPDLEESMYRGDLVSARRGLIKKLQGFRDVYKKELRIHLFIDGKKEQGNDTKRETVAGLELYYSHDLSADHLIMEFIKRYPSPGELYVVSSDKDILFYAKKFRCNRFTSEEFASFLNAEMEKANQSKTEEKPEMSERDLNFWRDFFRAGKRGIRD